MSDAEFHHFLDNVGHLVQPQQFRLSVYQGGVEPALRKVVWRHLLNVYPHGMTGRQRFEYLQRKTREYYRLREDWRELFNHGKDTDDIKFVTNMVKKDVLRTDRAHPFYAGADDSANILALFNVLVTYALTHPDIAYCQGMSDIASPILVVQNDEAHAYICFCGAMKRLKANFAADGETITIKFQHLSLAMQHHDPLFYAYMKAINADDMFFCYRWLLLELKREFPFDSALFMLETMWSSLPPDPPEEELKLVDTGYSAEGLGYSSVSLTLANQAYMRLRSQRRTHKVIPDAMAQSAITPCEDRSKIDPKDFQQLDDKSVEALKDTCCSIERSLGSSGEFGSCKSSQAIELDLDKQLQQMSIDRIDTPENDQTDVENGAKLSEANESSVVSTPAISTPATADSSMKSPLHDSPQRPADIPIKQLFVPGSSGDTQSDPVSPQPPAPQQNGTEKTEIGSCEEALESHPSIDFVKVQQEKPAPLPPPHEIGAGNPFLVFLCLTLLLQQRDHAMANRMDYNDLAMCFDRMVRRHNVNKVLHQAKSLYSVYLRQQASVVEEKSPEDVSV